MATRDNKWRLMPSAIILAIGMAASIAAFLGLQNWEHEKQATAFRETAEERFVSLQSVLSTGTEVLHSLVAFYLSSDEVTRLEFQTFSGHFLKDHPEIQALSWNPYVTANERATVEQRVRDEGFLDFSFTERNDSGELMTAAERDDYVAVIYLEPYAGNEGALGFDILSSANRNSTIIAARDSGAAAVTGRVSLVQGTTSQFGILAMLPIYRNGATLETVEQRRLEFEGLVVAVFKAVDLFGETIFADHSRFHNHDVYIFDQSAAVGSQRLYPTLSNVEVIEDLERKISFSRTIEFAGNEWQFVAVPADLSVFNAVSVRLIAFSMFNILFSILLAAYLRSLLIQREQLEQAEKDRLQKDERYKAIVDNARDAIVIFDVETGKFIEANPRAAEIFGLPTEELIGNYGPLDFSPEFQPDGRKSCELTHVAIEKVKHGEALEFEWLHINADGREIPTVITLGCLPDPERFLVRGSITDISQRKEGQRQNLELQSRLAQSQRLDAIGKLTGGVAHDFNNLLAVILGNQELLGDEITDLNLKKLISSSVEATQRGAELTRNMLSFAQQAPLEPIIVDLNQLVKNMKNWIGRTLPSTIDVETSLLAGLWPIKVDASSAESALLNLILNARDAMAQSGKLTIETSNVRIDDEYVEMRGEKIEPGRYVLLAVSDTGEGIPPENMLKIFEPFFTTKAVGSGTGLGLSMLDGFMKQTGGTASVYSEQGIGTTFKLYFPASTDAPDQDSSTPRLMELNGDDKNSTILLVEDNAEVLETIRTTLLKKGYRVLTAISGDAAREVFEEEPGIDLLLTDIVMPGELQGTTLATALRELRPDLPVVFMSGYAREATVHGNGLRPQDIRLMKPVRREDLLRALDKALLQGGGSAIKN